MLVLDRVLCDCCGDDMGQLLGGEVVRPGFLTDQTKAPHFVICPDCVFWLDQFDIVEAA